MENIDGIYFFDKSINPLEIIVITDNTSKLNGIMQKQKLDYLYIDEQKTRVRVKSFRELGLKYCKQYLLRYSKEFGKDVVGWDEKIYDLVLLSLYINDLKNESWVNRQIMLYLSQHHDISDKNDIINLFKTLLNEIKLDFDWGTYNRGILYNRIFHKLAIKEITFLIAAHINKTSDSYVETMKNKCLETEKIERISGKNNGSACTLIRKYDKEDCFFIKGNAPGIYSLSHEICAQKRLKSVDNADSLFLLMNRCDDNDNWIEYPYVELISLADYAKNHILTRKELDSFGEMLIAVLDILKHQNIIHSDLRENNIMVSTGENDATIFKVIDFGGAVIDGVSPWKKNDIINKYYRRYICGNYRYNKYILDDAASAYIMYINAGGNSSDKCACEIKKRIGQLFVESY